MRVRGPDGPFLLFFFPGCVESEEIFFYSGWPQIQGILSSGQSVNVSGASSTLNYDLETEELESAMEIWRIIPLEDNNYCFSTQQICNIEDGCSELLWTEPDATPDGECDY